MERQDRALSRLHPVNPAGLAVIGHRKHADGISTENELRIEREELRAFPEEERDELEMIYRAKGISSDAAQTLADAIMDRDDVALETLAREELGLDPGALASPWVAAIASFLAFALGAALPVLPFLFGSGAAPTVVAAVLSLTTLAGSGAAAMADPERWLTLAGARLASQLGRSW